MGIITAVCISEKKGTPKKDIGSCMLVKEFGLAGDAHAGSERQVSLLPTESVERFRALMRAKAEDVKDAVKIEDGAFGENLQTFGLDYSQLKIGTRLRVGKALLEVTQIGKQCHAGCVIRNLAGDCIMPREGVFARVLEGGVVKKGNNIKLYETKPFSAAVLTSSDRAFYGGYEDKSGPVIAEKLIAAGFEIKEQSICPDDEDKIYDELMRMADIDCPDIIITTGGTGFSLRDRMPEATLRLAERNAPGIAEAIRACSMLITKNAMLSRAVSVIRKRTLIINLPGSPKAVGECMDFVMDVLPHAIETLRGEADK
ncbi:MAG: MOSC domain-containing protein [Lachnospiraceae bacterium]|nr:MOSC domain-containing protein [Lachnospiraceae bacterium]